MKLGVADRIFIRALDTLPQTGTFLKMGVLNRFLDEIQFKPEELENWKITESKETGTINWDTKAERNINICISETLLSMVLEAVEKSENIHRGALATFQKFYDLKKWFEKEKKEGGLDGGKDCKDSSKT